MPLDVVDNLGDLTAGFSRQIWRKITILGHLRRPLHGGLVVESVEGSRNADTDLA